MVAYVNTWRRIFRCLAFLAQGGAFPSLPPLVFEEILSHINACFHSVTILGYNVLDLLLAPFA